VKKGRVLIAGFTTRHVAQSAFHAGYEVVAIDHFCDLDLDWYTIDQRKFEELSEIPALIDELCSTYRFDFLVVTSGAEMIHAPVPLLGSSPDCVEKFLDKLEIQHFFVDHGIPAPSLAPPGEYPCIIKPRTGAGGWRNQIITSEEEQKTWIELFPDVPYLCQRIVEGIPASVSCVSNGHEARAISINEQILRGDESERAFGFAGAITPFDHPMAEQMRFLAEQAAAESGCIGSVGVDFVIGRETWAIEINPRFQATLDTVERATGYNLFDLHVNACRGSVPETMPAPVCTAARTIVFADRDLVVQEDLSTLAPAVADIPRRGTVVEEGSALLSVYGWGSTRASACALLDKTITEVRRYMTRW
jgi:predicted ATP-grasp superfamily ATP-dependent carboligase